jgi:hypothetical protein
VQKEMQITVTLSAYLNDERNCGVAIDEKEKKKSLILNLGIDEVVDLICDFD